MDNLSKEIVKNRIKLEKSMASRYDVSEVIFAELFQVPGNVVAKDVKEGKIEFTGTKPFDVDKQKQKLYALAKKHEDDGLSKEESLANIGMWTDKVFFSKENAIGSTTYFSKEQDALINKAVNMARYGYTLDTIVKNVSLTAPMVELTKNLAGDKAFKSVVFGMGAQEDFANKQKDTGDDIYDINRANGASIMGLRKGFDEARQYKKTAAKKWEKENGTAKKDNRNNHAHEAYVRWKNGECTQQEMANEYGVNRVTIMNWIRAEKIKDKDFLMENIPTVRRRNIQSINQSERNENISYAVKRFSILKEKDMSATNIIKEIASDLKLTEGTVWNYLRDEGLIGTKFENRNGLQNAKKASSQYKKAYDNKLNTIFGYGPNADTSLDRAKYSLTIDNARNLGYELKHNKDAKSYLKGHDGDMTGYFEEKLGGDER